MAKKRAATKGTEVGKSVPRTTRRPQTQQQIDDEEEVCWIAAIYCLRVFPTLWTVGDIREEPSVNGLRRWIVAVHLRYPTGHEGYVGDLLIEGVRITELTDRDVMRARSRQIAADPALQREWDAFRASALPDARKAQLSDRAETG